MYVANFNRSQLSVSVFDLFMFNFSVALFECVGPLKLGHQALFFRDGLFHKMSM